MEKSNITALKTAMVLIEMTELIGDINAACEYMKYATDPSFHREHNICRLKAVFGIISYAVNAAYDKHLDYCNDFSDAFGFDTSFLDTEGNAQRDVTFPFACLMGGEK
jgi:hypothetical protein